MTQHLKYCKQRAAAIAASAAEEKAPKQKLFHIVAEGRYDPQYWLHLEIPAEASLFILDRFFRHIWVECCDHLSAFEIAGTSYADEPTWGDYTIKVIGAEEDEEEDDEVADEEEEADVEEEDSSPEEIAVEIGRFLDEEVPPEMHDLLLDELQAELRKPRSRDDLVVFLKAQLKAMPGVTSIYELTRKSEDVEKARSYFFQKRILEYLLEEFEDRSLDVPLEKVVKVGQKFKYAYDFGSTTHLNLRVASEREGGPLEGKEFVGPATVLARNVPPVILCRVCDKPATKVASGYFPMEENAYCDKCARRSRDEEMMLPVVNSPRIGVCGYTG
jgi:hypothetical protein